MKTLASSFMALAVTFAAASSACAEGETHVVVRPDEIVWKDMTVVPPGAKFAVIEGVPAEPGPFTLRIKFPANFEIPAHWHPAIEHVTVLSGGFNFGEGDKLDKSKTKLVPVGGFAYVLARHNHFAWTTEETVIQLHGVGPWGITYVNPADDPRKK